MLYLEDKIAKIVDKVSKILPKDGLMGAWEESDGIFDGWDEDVLYALTNIDPDVDVCCGASKMVIIPSFCNYVIKIPLRGQWIENYNEEKDEYDYYYSPFEFSGYGKGDDYCEAEVCIYEKTLEENPEYSFIFPETKFYKQINDVKYYLQEKCKQGEGFVKNLDTSKEVETTAENIRDTLDTGSLTWCIALAEHYGIELAKKITNFLEEERICDLHCGNIGYNMAGKPVIIDFSGFYY